MRVLFHCRKEYNMAFKIKPGHETITKTFRLPVKICEQLEQLAFDNNLSLNAVVVQCLEYALEDTTDNHDCDKE